MAKFKLEEKLFLSKAIISNVHSMRLKSRFVDNLDNETLVDEAIALAVLTLEKRNLLLGESTKINSVKKQVPELEFDNLINDFHLKCPELPRLTSFTEKRKKSVLRILETFTSKEISDVFENVHKSDHLSGRRLNSDWKASFDWIFKPENFIKILEGNYQNKEKIPETQKERTFGRMTESTVEKNFMTLLNSIPDGER